MTSGGWSDLSRHPIFPVWLIILRVRPVISRYWLNSKFRHFKQHATPIANPQWSPDGEVNLNMIYQLQHWIWYYVIPASLYLSRLVFILHWASQVEGGLRVGTVCRDAHLPVTTVCDAHVVLWPWNAFCIIRLLCGKYADQLWVLSALLGLCVAYPLITCRDTEYSDT